MADVYIVSEHDNGECDVTKVDMETVKRMVECFCKGNRASDELDEAFEASLAKLAAAMLDDVVDVWLDKVMKDEVPG